MKKVLLIQLLLSASIINAQPVVQPIASGDYWQIDQFQSRLPELATKTSFPATIQFTNGYAGINNLYVNKQIGSNEIVWQLGAAKNVAGFVIEWSRDLKNFERAGVVQVVQANEDRFVFRHRFENSPLVYYRVGIVTNARTVAYTPAVQVFDEDNNFEYDALIYVANWPERRSHAWKSLLQARAIENQCYVIGVNRVGEDGNGIYHSGDSMVIDPLGEMLYHKRMKKIFSRLH